MIDTQDFQYIVLDDHALGVLDRSAGEMIYASRYPAECDELERLGFIQRLAPSSADGFAAEEPNGYAATDRGVMYLRYIRQKKVEAEAMAALRKAETRRKRLDTWRQLVMPLITLALGWVLGNISPFQLFHWVERNLSATDIIGWLRRIF